MKNSLLIQKYVFISCAFLLAQLVYGAVNTNEPPLKSNHLFHGQAGVEKKPLQNCSEPAVEQFPKFFFNMEQRRNGWLAIHIILSIYMFACLSTLCEDYFIPAVEITELDLYRQVLTDTLKIDHHVAGATFVAGASSVPAIASSIIAILVAKGDLGVSTALGSAVLNAAGVISVGALFAGKVVMLSRWPLYRDSTFCFVSMVILLITMYDDVIMWYEATILLLGYILYIIFMVYDDKLKRAFLKRFRILRDKPCPGMKVAANGAAVPVVQDFPTSRVTLNGFDCNGDDQSRRRSCQTGLLATISYVNNRNGFIDFVEFPSPDDAKIELPTAGQQETSINGAFQSKPGTGTDSTAATASDREPYFRAELSPPRNHYFKIFWLLYLPFILLFTFTIPNCYRKGCEKFFVLTLLISTLYISIGSYILVWMISIIGYTLNVPDAAMGLTFLAIGVTLPDIVISVLVVRKGHADMAVSNAMGSNIVEILVGLALPWLVKIVFVEPGQPIIIESRGMMYFTIYLLLTLVFLLVLTHICKWVMTITYGAILMLWYVVFLALSVLHELGFLGGERLTTCPSSY